MQPLTTDSNNPFVDVDKPNFPNMNGKILWHAFFKLLLTMNITNRPTTSLLNKDIKIVALDISITFPTIFCEGYKTFKGKT